MIANEAMFTTPMTFGRSSAEGGRRRSDGTKWSRMEDYRRPRRPSNSLGTVVSRVSSRGVRSRPFAAWSGGALLAFPRGVLRKTDLQECEDGGLLAAQGLGRILFAAG